MSETIFLFGASVRALAQSVVRAGLRPICCDLFADLDLGRLAEAHRLDRTDYPAGFAAFGRRMEGRPWMYTGGLENSAELLEELSKHGPLWGNSASAVRRARDPYELKRCLGEIGLPMPEILAQPVDTCSDGSWLVKPLAGTGGVGIGPWLGEEIPATSYLQRRADGLPCSAVYVGSQSGTAVLLGATRQLIGADFCNAPDFRYCGNIGPLTLSATETDQLQAAGNVLTARLGLRGIFGLDFLLDGSAIRPLEVNPRYTASVEVLERGLGTEPIAMHRDAFRGQSGEPSPRSEATSTCFVGKAVLFARGSCRLRPDAPCYGFDADPGRRDYADVPSPQTRFSTEEPMLTVFAEGNRVSQCEGRLREATERFERDWVVRRED